MRKWLILLFLSLAVHLDGERLSFVRWQTPIAESPLWKLSDRNPSDSRCEVRMDRSRLVELLTESSSNPAYSEPTAPFSCRVQRLSEASSEYSVLRYGEIYAGNCRPSTQMVKSFSFAVLLRAGQPVERYVLRLRRLLI